MTAIKPTIGQVVWFWLNNEACYAENAQPNAALVTFVHSDDTVNLSVFDKNGDGLARPAVHLWQGEGPRPSSPHCEWMPYQKGQAAKVDAGIDSTLPEKRIVALEQQLDAVKSSLIKPNVPLPGLPPALNTTVGSPSPPK